MNCTVCGKPHSKEQPLTVAYNDELLCPGCLKKLDQYSKLTGKPGKVINDAPRSRIVGISGTVSVGNSHLPIIKFEME